MRKMTIAATAALTLFAVPVLAGTEPAAPPAGQSNSTVVSSTVAIAVTRSSASTVTVSLNGNVATVPISALPPAVRNAVQRITIGQTRSGNTATGGDISVGIANLLAAYF